MAATAPSPPPSPESPVVGSPVGGPVGPALSPSGSRQDSRPAAKSTAEKSEKVWIAGPLYDCVFFLYAPLIALVIGLLLTRTSLVSDPVTVLGETVLPSNVLILTFISAHLVIVFFRSHGNREVFARHPWRFTLAPALLFGACFASTEVAVTVSVVGIWWDVYHSSMQTFGLGRIYDAKLGNDREAGRGLDLWFNLVLYIGPILAGASFMLHLDYFKEFQRVDWMLLADLPARIDPLRSAITVVVVAISLVSLVAWLIGQVRLARSGYRVSKQKILLFAGTGLVSIYAWGFNSFGQGFFIMNFFHAWQYFALVWWIERGSMRSLFRMPDSRLGMALTLGLFLSLGLGYGLLVTFFVSIAGRALWCLALVVSIMHFWYDGFIWSVRRREV